MRLFPACLLSQCLLDVAQHSRSKCLLRFRRVGRVRSLVSVAAPPLLFRAGSQLPRSTAFVNPLAYGGLGKIRTRTAGGGRYGASLPAFMSTGSQRGEGRASALSNLGDTVSGLAIVVMGVSGCGKSTIGELLGKCLSCPFIDADDFHSVENKEKMRNGVPLTDKDRLPWLQKLQNELANYINKGERVVLACSALQPQYRDILLNADPFHRVQDEQNVFAQKISDENLKSEDSGRDTWYRGNVIFAYLECSVELLASRLTARHEEGKHFMSPSLLRSQLDLLEIREGDNNIIFVDAGLSPEDIVNSIKKRLLLKM